MKTCPICHRKTVKFFGTSSYKCSSCGIVPPDLVPDRSPDDREMHDTTDESFPPTIVSPILSFHENASTTVKIWVYALAIMFLIILIAVA